MPVAKGQASLKVENGKLVKAKVEIHNNILAEVQILGDFFMHPEDACAAIEQKLEGMSPNESAITFAEQVARLVKEKGFRLVGVTPEAIGMVVKEAIKDAGHVG